MIDEAADFIVNSPRLAADLARHGRMNDATAALIDVEATDINEAATENVPIGHCPCCGVPVYTREGFCGGCKP